MNTLSQRLLQAATATALLGVALACVLWMCYFDGASTALEHLRQHPAQQVAERDADVRNQHSTRRRHPLRAECRRQLR
jgi:hypothetical protein